jgi:hypothetical protein
MVFMFISKCNVSWRVLSCGGVKPCSRMKVDRLCGGMCRLHLQGNRLSQAVNQRETGSKLCTHGVVHLRVAEDSVTFCPLLHSCAGLCYTKCNIHICHRIAMQVRRRRNEDTKRQQRGVGEVQVDKNFLVSVLNSDDCEDRQPDLFAFLV